MTTLASGGNAMASSQDLPPPSLTPGYGGDKGIFSNHNPSGKQSDMNSGTPANVVASTSPYVSMASSIKPSSGMAGMHQDTYVTGQSAWGHHWHQAKCMGHRHQPSMDNDHMEASSQESPTIIPSKPMTQLKAYQMKLVIQKNKESKRKSATTYSDNDVYG